jgi:type II secretory pathway component PulF
MSTIKLFLHLTCHAFAAIAIFAVLALIVPVYSIYFRHIQEPALFGTTKWVFSCSATLFHYWYLIIPLVAIGDFGIVFGPLRQREVPLQVWTALILSLTIVFSLVCHIGLAAPLQKEGLRLDSTMNTTDIPSDQSSAATVPSSR